LSRDPSPAAPAPFIAIDPTTALLPLIVKLTSLVYRTANRAPHRQTDKRSGHPTPESGKTTPFLPYFESPGDGRKALPARIGWRVSPRQRPVRRRREPWPCFTWHNN